MSTYRPEKSQYGEGFYRFKLGGYAVNVASPSSGSPPVEAPIFRLVDMHSLYHGKPALELLHAWALELLGGTTVDRLWYVDSEGDIVVVLSEEDFAVFIRTKATKLFAQVSSSGPSSGAPSSGSSSTASSAKNLNSDKDTPKKSSRSFKSRTTQTKRTASRATSTQTTTGSPSNKTKDCSTPIANNTVVDAMADLLTCAAVSLQAGVTQAHPVWKHHVKHLKNVPKHLGQHRFPHAHRQYRSAAPKTNTNAATVAPVPFIHGRHTCDQCLTTPIVGRRFHATNSDDYDLCEACHQAYVATSSGGLEFATVELDRDLPFQSRWARKFARMERNNELAVEEAVRRSLLDKPKGAGQEEAVVDCKNSSTMATKEDEANTMESTVPEAGKMVVDPSDENNDAVKEPRDENNIAVKEPQDVGTVDNEVNDVSDSPTEPNETSQTEDDVCHEQERERGERNKKQADDVSPDKCMSSSFAKEAEENGEVAAFVGKTLDRLGNAIDNIILDGDSVVTGNDGNEEEDSSWSVVADDEQMARAAETLGSALFHSDMQSSSNLSSITSVPTVVPVVLKDQRWENHLAQLHDLGFLNDALLVETLVLLSEQQGGDNSVTVQQVVDHLMQDW